MKRIRYSIVACALTLMALSCGHSNKSETASVKEDNSIMTSRSFAGYKAEHQLDVRPESETVDGILGSGDPRNVPEAIPGGILPEVTITATRIDKEE